MNPSTVATIWDRLIGSDTLDPDDTTDYTILQTEALDILRAAWFHVHQSPRHVSPGHRLSDLHIALCELNDAQNRVLAGHQ